VATVTSVIELLVGLACLGLGAVVWPRTRFLATVLVIAGLIAAIHATVDLI